MSTDTVSLFLALLAIFAEVGAVVGLVLAVGSRFSPALAGARDRVVEAVSPQALWVAFQVAAVSMAGSLYFSEVADFTPCRLCWYQRICMYPLVPILGIAAWRRDAHVRVYAAALAVIGLVISSYHVLVERFPSLESDVCEVTNPCTVRWVEELGYLTIPTMALSGFAFILALLGATRPTEEES